ncbi:hypothetical protein DENSPDRAFT_878772 [Dentipellis sp. KUC8613]|nr:hypothetical protein DENSPDRAFT_878772 [Dentipellis sp. KUC8613]
MSASIPRGSPVKGRTGVARVATSAGPRFAPPPPPATRHGRMYMGGLAVVGTLFGGFYYYLHSKQERKLANDAVPTWEYRFHQSNSSPAVLGGNADALTLRASSVENRVDPLEPRSYEHNAQHTTRRALREAGSDAYPRDQFGAPTHPVPQRDRGDGLAYTKRTP